MIRTWREWKGRRVMVVHRGERERESVWEGGDGGGRGRVRGGGPVHTILSGGTNVFLPSLTIPWADHSHASPSCQATQVTPHA